MRSATSYFNGTLYRKTLARYWPLWAGYVVIWAFLMPLNLLNQYLSIIVGGYRDINEARLNEALQFPEFVVPGMYFAAFFAVLCAMAVFGYLYSSRSSCWFHALPMRREALFTTQYLAGLSFLLLPQLAIAVLTAMVEVAFLPMSNWGQALGALLAWLAAISGICLFFFSFAAFCAMFTGHILALPAFYGILNILAAVIYELVDSLMREFFFGYTGSPAAYKTVEYLTPTYALRDAAYWRGSSDVPRFESPGTIAAYALVGVALAFAALYVYRRRHAETAGDVVAIPLVRPLFKYGVSFCAGLCFGMFTTAFFGWNTMNVLIPCVLFWAVVGYFVAEMLLSKSFRVFRRWKGAVTMPLVLLALCLTCSLDLFGVETRVPSVDQVERMGVEIDMGYPSDDGGRLFATLKDRETIQKFIDLHQAIVDDRARLDRERKTYRSGNDYVYLSLWYTLEGGRSLDRSYASIPLYREDLNKEGTVTNLIQQLYQDRDIVAQAYDFEGFLKDSRLTSAYLYNLSGPSGSLIYDCVYVDDYAQELWDAVQQDFAEGNIGVRYLFNNGEDRQNNTYVTDLCFGSTPLVHPSVSGNYSTSSSTLSITLTPQAKHTLAVLDKTGIFEEGYSLALRQGADTDSYPSTYHEGDSEGFSTIVY